MFGILGAGLEMMIGTKVLEVGVRNITNSVVANEGEPEKLTGVGYVNYGIVTVVGGALLVHGVREILNELSS